MLGGVQAGGAGAGWGPLTPRGAHFCAGLAAAAKCSIGFPFEGGWPEESGARSQQKQGVMAEEKMGADVLDEPNVRALFEEFPDATLESIDQKEA